MSGASNHTYYILGAPPRSRKANYCHETDDELINNLQKQIRGKAYGRHQRLSWLTCEDRQETGLVLGQQLMQLERALYLRMHYSAADTEPRSLALVSGLDVWDLNR
jgi:hypothetical protein